MTESGIEMDKTIKTVTIGHRQLLDVLQVIHVQRTVADDRANVDEVMCLENLNYEMLGKMKNTETGCTIDLDNETRFAIWLALDIYKIFCTETKQTDELNYCIGLMESFR